MRTSSACLFSMVALTMMVSASTYAEAGDDAPPPTLTTNPSPAPANQPFEAVFHIYYAVSAFGVQEEDIQVDGNTITVPFNHSCGFICPGPTLYAAYPFQMPALPPGIYRVRVVEISGPYVYGEFTLGVGAVTVPASNTISLVALIAMLLSLGGILSMHTQSARRG